MRSRRSVLHFGLVAAAMLGISPPGLLEINKGGGRVSAIDDQTRSFTCTWKTRTWTFRTTDKTAYFVGSRRGSWSDLKVGAVVRITFHRLGGERIADEIRINGT